MKKYIYILILFLFSISCKTQNKELQEAQIELEEKIQGITSLLDFMDSSVVFAPTNKEIKDSLTKRDFKYAFNLKDSIVIKEKIENYLDSLHFYQTIQYPKNYIELNYDDNNIGNIIGDFGYFSDKKKEEPIYLLQKVFFKDKTTLSPNDTIDYGISAFKKGLQLKSSKPIEKLAIEVHYQYPIIKKFSLGKGNTKISLSEGEIILKRLDKNQVTLIMPKTLKERLVGMNAIYNDGRVLDSKGMSGNTLPSKKKLDFFKSVLTIQQDALKKLKDNEFKDKNALEIYINNKMPDEPKEEAPLYTGTYYFSGNVSSLDVFIKKEQNVFNKKNIVIETGSYRKSIESKIGYYIATDSITGKDGLVGIDGQWKIQPDFEDLRFNNDFYYKGTYGDDLNQLYHLNITQNKLYKVSSYDIHEIKLYHGNLAIISKSKSFRQLFGVLNAETDQTIIPNKYKYIKVENGLFIVENLERKEGVYDKNGRQILSEIYSDIEIHDKKIHTSIYVKNASDVEEVFSLKGIKLK